MSVSPTNAPAALYANGNQKQILVRSYTPQDHAVVVDLFTDGLLVYADDSSREGLMQYIQRSLNEDLADINATYFASGGHFWIATMTEEDTEVVVGMIALENKADGTGELRRMSVRNAYRRYGIGRLLVSTLEQWATTNGFAKVWLSTGENMPEAQRFYVSLGYVHTKTEVYSPTYTALTFEKCMHDAKEMPGALAKSD